MKKLGIVLIVLEVLAIISGFITGKSVFLKFLYSNEPGASLIAELIGYLLPGIIGIILVSKGSKREREAAASGSAADAYTASSSSYSTGSSSYSTTSAASGTSAGKFCPKCGEKVDPGDAFCVNCGAKLMR